MFEDQNTETIGQYILKIRNKRGYSQRKLALLSGISNTTINRIENGDTPNPDLNTIKALAVALGIEEQELLKIGGYLNDTKEADTDYDLGDLEKMERDLEKMMQSLKTDPTCGFAAYGGDCNISEEDLALMEDAFRTALRVVRRVNKDSHVQKKNKK